LIIFGFRSFVKTLAMLTLVCDHCHNPAAHRVVQRSRWFTLFFIPVVPISFSRFTTCTYCGTTRKISKQEAEELRTGGTGATMGQPAPLVQPAPRPIDQPPTSG
jgi:hypothetical protein